MDAWAVLTDRDEVGGPDENMERLGLENRRGVADVVTEGESSVSCSLDEVLRDSIRDGLVLRRAGGDTVDALLPVVRLRSAIMFLRLGDASCSSDSSPAMVHYNLC